MITAQNTASPLTLSGMINFIHDMYVRMTVV